METKAEIVRAQPGALVRNTLDPQALIEAAVQNNAGIETLERLVKLAKEVRQDQASEAWHMAMAQFQKDCPPIGKSKTANIQTKGGGSFRYSYAPLGEIMATILPVMGPLGLSVSYRVSHEPDRITAICRVSHESGHHEESGPVSMPVEKADGVGANAAQRVGIASTYAKRYALLAIIGLAPEDDLDGKPPAGKAPAPVAMPQRKSAGKGPVTPQSSAAPAAAPAGEPPTSGTWTGKIEGVKTENGTNQKTGNPWIRHDINIGGDKIVTFSETQATAAREALDAQMMVCIDWKLGPYGKVVQDYKDPERPEIYPASDDDFPQA